MAPSSIAQQQGAPHGRVQQCNCTIQCTAPFSSKAAHRRICMSSWCVMFSCVQAAQGQVCSRGSLVLSRAVWCRLHLQPGSSAAVSCAAHSPRPTEHGRHALQLSCLPLSTAGSVPLTGHPILYFCNDRVLKPLQKGAIAAGQQDRPGSGMPTGLPRAWDTLRMDKQWLRDQAALCPAYVPQSSMNAYAWCGCCP